MKILISIILAASLALTGCMSPQHQAATARAKAAKQQMVAGQIKKSEYYAIIYKEAKKLNDAPVMDAASYMITASLAFEAGKISKAEFDARLRVMESYYARVESARDKQRRIAVGAALAGVSTALENKNTPSTSWSNRSNSSGGMNYYDSVGRPIGSSRSNFSGGYDYYDSTGRPLGSSR